MALKQGETVAPDEHADGVYLVCRSRHSILSPHFFHRLPNLHIFSWCPILKDLDFLLVRWGRGRSCARLATKFNGDELLFFVVLVFWFRIMKLEAYIIVESRQKGRRHVDNLP